MPHLHTIVDGYRLYLQSKSWNRILGPCSYWAKLAASQRIKSQIWKIILNAGGQRCLHVTFTVKQQRGGSWKNFRHWNPRQSTGFWAPPAGSRVRVRPREAGCDPESLPSRSAQVWRRVCADAWRSGLAEAKMARKRSLARGWRFIRV